MTKDQVEELSDDDLRSELERVMEVTEAALKKWGEGLAEYTASHKVQHKLMQEAERRRMEYRSLLVNKCVVQRSNGVQTEQFNSRKGSGGK
jgi:hypothetical protein